MVGHVIIFGLEEAYREAGEEERGSVGPCRVVARVDDSGVSDEVEFAGEDRGRDRLRFFGGRVELGKEPAAMMPECGRFGRSVDAEEKRYRL
jgi:hypothetical protein